MRFLKVILSIMLCTMSVPLYAQTDVAGMTDEQFDAYMLQIKEDGNRCYLHSDRAGILAAANRCRDAVDARAAVRNLADKTVDSLLVTYHKLLGDYYYEYSDFDVTAYAEAQSRFDEALAYYRAWPSEAASADSVVIHGELAQLYYKQAKYQPAYDEAVTAFSDMARRYDDFFCSDYDYYQSLSTLAMCEARVGRFDDALAHIDAVIENYAPSSPDDVSVDARRRKAKILLLAGDADAGAMRDAVGYYKEYFEQSKADAVARMKAMTASQRRDYWLRMRPFLTDCYRIEGADAAFLYDVTLFSKALLLELYRGHDTLSAGWRDVQRNLRADECAVEFVQYERGDAKRMCALVLGREGKPRFVEMPAPDSVYNYNIGAFAIGERLALAENKRNALYADTIGFGRMIWHRDLLDAFGDAKRVFFAPDGYMHQIAVEYIVPPEARHIEWRRLTSTRNLLAGRQYAAPASATIIGGVDYSLSGGDAVPVDNDVDAHRYIRDCRVSFKPLPGSLVEVKNIYGIRSNASDTLVSGCYAAEGVVRSLLGNCDMAHVSTHGYFGSAAAAVGSDLKPNMTDNALSECVLAFAGVTPAIEAESGPDVADGLLSAAEISKMDLARVRLAVIAACQTGLGYVTPDGVFGLQRGLKNAGVGTMVLSLWNVNDDATSLLMSEFHRQINDGVAPAAAMARARKSLLTAHTAEEPQLRFDGATMSLRNTGVETRDFGKPQYTDAFIVIDDISY